jgi:hypothetical protein
LTSQASFFNTASLIATAKKTNNSAFLMVYPVPNSPNATNLLIIDAPEFLDYKENAGRKRGKHKTRKNHDKRPD